jgi:hypothetical protein
METVRNLQDRRIGIEIEVESDRVSSDDLSIILQHSRDWEVDYDEGSLRGGRYGWEIKTAGNGIPFGRMRSSLDTLYPALTGSSGNWRAAVHVHVSTEDMDSVHLGRALALAYCLDDSIFNMSTPSRRESNFCVPLDSDPKRTMSAIQALSDGLYRRGSSPFEYGAGGEWCKYTSVNIIPLGSFGTIEFRHLQTPRCDATVLSVAAALRSIWRYATTVTKLVHVCRFAPFDGASMGEFLSNDAVEHYIGMAPCPERAYHVLEHMSPAVGHSMTDVDLPSLVKVTPSRLRGGTQTGRINWPNVEMADTAVSPSLVDIVSSELFSEGGQ